MNGGGIKAGPRGINGGGKGSMMPLGLGLPPFKNPGNNGPRKESANSGLALKKVLRAPVVVSWAQIGAVKQHSTATMITAVLMVLSSIYKFQIIIIDGSSFKLLIFNYYSHTRTSISNVQYFGIYP